MEFMRDTYRKSRRWEFFFYGITVGIVTGIIIGSGILLKWFV